MSRFGVIFDCDGTLVDSLDQALQSFNFALAEVGEEPRSPEEIKRYFGAGADRILARIVGDEAKGARAFESYLRHQSELASQTYLHPGVRELLETLAAANIPMAVVTGRHERDLELVLAPHSLGGHFVAMIADNHAQKSKPAPDGILMAAAVMGLAPENVFYVGDAVYDLRAAHAAGSVAVAALWDVLANADELRAEKPHFVAESPDQVWTHFCERFPVRHR